MPQSPGNNEEGPKPVYPMLLVGLGIFFFGALWSLVEVDRPEFSAQVEALEDPAEIGPGDLDVQVRDEPVDFTIEPNSPRYFTLQFRQQYGGVDFDDDALDARMEFGGRETIERRRSKRVIDWEMAPRGIDIRRGGERVDVELADQVEAGLASMHYRNVVDPRGRVHRGGWADDDPAKSQPVAMLATAMLAMLIPKFPDEPVLVGEDWFYGLSETRFESIVDADVQVDATVEERFEAVFADEKTEVAAIDRELTVRIYRPLSEQDRQVTMTGRGTAYFDLRRGRLLASNLIVESGGFWVLDDDSQQRGGTIKAAWFLH